MNKLIIFFLLSVAVLTFSACNDEPVPTTYHTVFAEESMGESVVVKEYTVRKGEFISAIVEKHDRDHKKMGGYSMDMFLADNPHIACRPIKEVKRCDTLAYHSRFIYPGDLLYLRLALKIKTVPGNGSNVIRKDPDPELESGFPCIHHAEHVIEACEEVVFIKDGFKPVLAPDGPGVVPGPNGYGLEAPTDPDSGSGGGINFNETPWWAWLLIFLTGLTLIFAIFNNKKIKENGDAIETETEALGEHISQNHQETRRKIETSGNAVAETLSTLNQSIKEQTEASSKLATEREKTMRQMSKDHAEVLKGVTAFLNNTEKDGKQKEE